MTASSTTEAGIDVRGLLSWSPSLESLYRVVAVVALLLLLQWLGQRQRRVRRAAALQVHAARKFNARNERRLKLHESLRDKYGARIPDAERSAFLLSLTATELLDHMHAKRDVSCVEVVLLYSLRAMAIGSLTNCVAEECYDEALEAAEAVDARIAARAAGRDKSTPGLLEGIPISVKDQFDQKGYDSTCGFACRAFRPLEEDGLLVSILREQGAIPFVRTTIPQGLMVPESMSLAWGVTSNPWNLERTPGGSSGGEGALLAARGSVLGLGSDIAGSLRIPAHFNGIYALKATPARITLDGLGIPSLGGVSGQLAIRPVAGPMGHSVDDLELVFRAWVRSESRMYEEDAFLAPGGVNERLLRDKAKMMIGYFESDGWFEPAPACSRAVRQAVAALMELGHEVVKFVPPPVPQAVRAYYGILSADSAQGVLSGLEGEDVHDYYKDLLLMLRIPRVLKGLLVRLLPHLGQHRAALMMSAIHPKDTEELYDNHILLLRYIESFTAAWKEAGLDGLVVPGLGVPAMRHGGSKELTLACSYTFLFNCLHYPVGTVPIGLTDKDEEDYSSVGGVKDLFSSVAAKHVAGSAGLPVGVQVVALPHQDERVLNIMRQLEHKIRFKEIPELANSLKI